MDIKNIDDRWTRRNTYENLETVLWSCVDILSGELSVAEYKDYIFGLLFLKRLTGYKTIES